MPVGGTWGKLLHVDLTDKNIWIEEPSDDVYLKLVGGRGLTAYLLLRDLPAGADPLGPENLLIFAPGILQGSNVPGTGRHGVGGKSPLTGAIASSEAGGWWGHEFKRAGFDALIVHGKSEAPVYLWIKDGEVEIRDAAHLWGKDTADVEWAIQEELDDNRIRVAQCGIAGENQVLFANVINDINRAAGRGGMGAVMGSKNLKAVATRGTLRVPVAERKRVGPSPSGWATTTRPRPPGPSRRARPPTSPRSARPAHCPRATSATPCSTSAPPSAASSCTRRSSWTATPARSAPSPASRSWSTKTQTFADNPYLRSDLIEKIKIDKAYGGPEYETMGSLGSAVGVDDMLAMAKANEYTARWGMDSISLGMTIAYVMECMEAGVLTPEQTGGILPAVGRRAGHARGHRHDRSRRGLRQADGPGLQEAVGVDRRRLPTSSSSKSRVRNCPCTSRASSMRWASAMRSLRSARTT